MLLRIYFRACAILWQRFQLGLKLRWFVFGIMCAYAVNLALNYADQGKPSLLADAEASTTSQIESLDNLGDDYLFSDLIDAPSLDLAITTSEGEVLPLPISRPEHADDTIRNSFGFEHDGNVVLTVAPNDNLTNMMIEGGVNGDDAFAFVSELRTLYRPSRLRVGQIVALTFSEKKPSGPLDSLTIETSSIQKVVVAKDATGKLSARKIDTPLDKTIKTARVTINNSIYQDGIAKGVSQSVLANMIKAYSYDVDFQREIHAGDVFEVAYEGFNTPEGKQVRTGQLLYASLTTGHKTIPIYYFERSNGSKGYYDANGQSVRKALLKTPVSGARVSSNFGMRHHPVLGYSKMHKGIDFSAPTGTPIYAAGDGVIETMSPRGSYGNYVRIRHSSKFSTAYAHMSRFANGLRSGKHVKQGQAIGYVGTTGRSTGPHLHYEILEYGQHVNPKSKKFMPSDKLEGKELAKFRTSTSKILAIMDEKDGQEMASKN